MPDKKPKIENIPSVEDLERDWGHESMSFFHDMVSPDDPQEHGEDEGPPSGAPGSAGGAS